MKVQVQGKGVLHPYKPNKDAIAAMHDKDKIPLQVQKLTEDAILPCKANYWDAGLDLFANEDVALSYGGVYKIKTGIAMAIPNGYVGIIKDRSSMGLKGLKVMGGVIDATYRGEVIVCLMCNISAHYIKKNQKIAQIILYKTPIVDIIEVPELVSTARGTGGFGSTGE